MCAMCNLGVLQKKEVHTFGWWGIVFVVIILSSSLIGKLIAFWLTYAINANNGSISHVLSKQITLFKQKKFLDND